MSKDFLNYNILLHIPMCYHFTSMLIMTKCVNWLLWLLRNQIESLNVSISKKIKSKRCLKLNGCSIENTTFIKRPFDFHITWVLKQWALLPWIEHFLMQTWFLKNNKGEKNNIRHKFNGDFIQNIMGTKFTKTKGFPTYMKTKTNYDKCKLKFKSKHKTWKSNIRT